MQWSGREKLHYINPVPINEIAERWIGKFERGRLRALRGQTLDAIVEGPSEETEYLLEGRLRSQAPEIDGRLLITDSGGRTLRPGDVVPVKIEKTFDYDLAGAVVAAR